MKPIAFRMMPFLAFGGLLAITLSSCYPNVPIFRFQLINQTPYNITAFYVAASETALSSAENRIAGSLGPNSVADADVPGEGQYWLRATADVNGTPVTRTRGPISMPGNTVGWAWHVDGENLVEGTDAGKLYAATSLPILVLDTNGTTIPDEPKIDATLYVIENDEGAPNRPTMTEAPFSTPIAIERRGYSTQTFPKASWTVELKDEAGDDADAALLGMPEEEDWVLYGPWMDRSLVRNVVGYSVWGDLGYYSPRTRFCELYLLDTPGESLVGSYEGVYVLTERIKRDSERLDVARLDPEDNAEPEISGGYILEMKQASRLEEGEKFVPLMDDFVLTLVSPNDDQITAAQRSWISQYMGRFERALFSDNFTDPEAGYAPFIDEQTFIDYMILQEFFKNRDAFHSSTFLYKDREAPLRMGPLWDLNIGMGYFSFQGLEGTANWILNTDGGEIARSPWTRRLLEDDGFRERFIARWRDLRGGILSTQEMNARIDAAAAELDTAQARQFIRWPSLGMILLPDIRFLMFAGPHPESYAGELRYMKNWLQDRGNWMDANLGSL
jgi:hypothetical protein